MSDEESRKRVLFVCTQNKVRSLTAENLYRARPDLEVKSCGTANFARIQISPDLVKWADAVFTFDDTQTAVLASDFRKDVAEKPVVCLGLPDVFTYKSDALVVKLIAKLDPYLGRPNAQRCPRNSVFSKRASSSAVLNSKKSAKASRSLVSNLLAAVGVRRMKADAAK